MTTENAVGTKYETLNSNEGKSQCRILICQKMSILLKLHYFIGKKCQ